MTTNRGVVQVFFFLFCYYGVYPQGCSDAGLCSIGSMESATAFYELSLEELLDMDVEIKREVKIRAVQRTGIGENGVLILTSEIEGVVSVSQSTSLFAVLPFRFTSGTLGKTHGVGDVSLGLQRRVCQVGQTKIDATLAVQIPSNYADKKIEGNPLPMPYQSSLGTFD